MNMMEANQLSRIYNTLLLVKTSGQDTKMMGQCLDAFEQFLTQAIIIDETDNKDEEINCKEV